MPFKPLNLLPRRHCDIIYAVRLCTKLDQDILYIQNNQIRSHTLHVIHARVCSRVVCKQSTAAKSRITKCNEIEQQLNKTIKNELIAPRSYNRLILRVRVIVRSSYKSSNVKNNATVPGKKCRCNGY